MEQNTVEDDEDTMAGVYNAWSKLMVKLVAKTHLN